MKKIFIILFTLSFINAFSQEKVSKPIVKKPIQHPTPKVNSPKKQTPKVVKTSDTTDAEQEQRQIKIDKIKKKYNDFEYVYFWNPFPNLVPRFVINNGSKYGIVDINDNIVVDFIYDKFHSKYENIVIMKKNDFYGLIDLKNGKEITEFKFKKICNPHANQYGLFWSSVDGSKFGFLNSNGNVIVPFEYDDETFCNNSSSKQGLISVSKNGKRGYIDSKGSVIIPFVYDRQIYKNMSNSYQNYDEKGYVPVLKNEKFGVIDTKNNIVIPFEYDYIESYEYGILNTNHKDAHFKVIKNGKNFFINQKNKCVKDCEYFDSKNVGQGILREKGVEKKQETMKINYGAASSLDNEPKNLQELLNNLKTKHVDSINKSNNEKRD